MYIVRVNQTDCEVVRSESKQFGAKDLDRILFDHFVAEIARKRGMTIRPGTKQAIRLCNGCRRVKEMLSSASTATFTVDGLLDGDEYTLTLSRAQMESLAKSQVEAVETMLKTLLSSFQEPISAVEMIGGGCRVAFMKRVVETATGLPLRFTVDSASCIAKGAALLGIFDTTKETLGVVGEWKLDGDVEKGEEFDATATLEQTLRIRDEQQQRRAEAHNRLEAE